MEEFGTPVCVRTDHVDENVRVCEFLEERRGSGSSVHNSRIERLWRDVTQCHPPTLLFFIILKQKVCSDQLICLLFTLFLCPGLINQFMLAWNNYSLSTENNLTDSTLALLAGQDVYQARH